MRKLLVGIHTRYFEMKETEGWEPGSFNPLTASYYSFSHVLLIPLTGKCVKVQDGQAPAIDMAGTSKYCLDELLHPHW